MLSSRERASRSAVVWASSAFLARTDRYSLELSITTAAWLARARSRSSSSWEKAENKDRLALMSGSARPAGSRARLFKTWTTPTTAPARLRIGTHRIERVR
jgi:hypothetical protein